MKGSRFKHLIISDSDEDSDYAKGIDYRERHSGGGNEFFAPRANTQSKGLVMPPSHPNAQSKEQGLDTVRLPENVENNRGLSLNTTSHVSNSSPFASRGNPDVINGTAREQPNRAAGTFTSVKPSTDAHSPLVTPEHIYGNRVPQEADLRNSKKTDLPQDFPGAKNTESGNQPEGREKAKHRRRTFKKVRQHEHEGFLGSNKYKERVSSVSNVDAARPPARLPQRAQQAAFFYSRPRGPLDNEILMAPDIPPHTKSQGAEVSSGSYSSEITSSEQHAENESRNLLAHEPFQASAPTRIGNLTEDAIAKRRELVIPARRPVIPSPSELKTESSHYDFDNEGNVAKIVPASVRRVVNADGRMVWVIVPSHRENNSFSMREVGFPPSRLSRRAEKIIAPRDVVELSRPEDDVKVSAPVDDMSKSSSEDVVELSRPEDDVKVSESEDIMAKSSSKDVVEMGVPVKEIHENSSFTGVPPQHQNFTLPSECYFSNACFQKHIEKALVFNKEWTVYPYNHQELCQYAWGALITGETRPETERLVRILQPIQTGPHADRESECGCIVYVNTNEAKLTELLSNPDRLKEAFATYLNMQPMEIDNPKLVKVADMVFDSSHSLQYHSILTKPVGEVKINTLGNATRFVGELSCTVERLCEKGPSEDVPKTTLPPQVMRLCGGLVFGMPLQEEDGPVLDVRRYELFLFLPDANNPPTYNSSPGFPILGQLTSPPILSFPLTPRIISDPMELETCREKLRLSSSFESFSQWGKDNQLSVNAFSENMVKGVQCLTLTLVTLNTSKKHAIDLTLVVLPYRACSKTDDGKVLAELPPFSPDTMLKDLRLRAISLTFSTKSAFMSAYMSLLWATECNIIKAVRPVEGNSSGSSEDVPSALLVSATISPLMPWSSLFGKGDPSTELSSVYRGHCMDFAAVGLTVSLGDAQSNALSGPNPLKLEDFVIKKYTFGEDLSNKTKVSGIQQRITARSQIPTVVTKPIPLQQYCSALPEGECFDGAEGYEEDAIVGYTPFGVVYRALNQKTQEMFDIQVIPRRYAFLGLTFDEVLNAKMIEKDDTRSLQKDTVAVLLLKYISCLPFQPRIYDVYSNNHFYYILQEPWMSIRALEQSIKGPEYRKMLEYNAPLKEVYDQTLIIPLKDFIHATLNPLHSDGLEVWDTMEARLQIIRLLIAQLLLLISSLHGKGALLGPCSTHRVLVQINAPVFEATTREESFPDDNSMLGELSSSRKCITSRSLSLFVPDIGVHTSAWAYERQQCGTLEYVPPMHIMGAMTGGEGSIEGCAWTTQDDWWSLLSISFELFAADGSTLVCPERKGGETLPPACTPLNSKFVSAEHILDVWKGVLTNQEIGADTTSKAINTRIRNYVQRRVLESIAPGLDSWLAIKVGEAKRNNATGVEYTKKDNLEPTIPPFERSKEGMNAFDVTLTSKEKKIDDTLTCLPLTDSLSDIPWILFYRDWFDTVMDAAFPYTTNPKCAVHAPLLCLSSHPFLGGMDLGAVFNGDYRLLPAAEEFFHNHMGKAKLRQALFLYRMHSHRLSTTNQQNGPHLGPSPGALIGSRSTPGSARPSTLQCLTDGRVSVHNVSDSLPLSELLSSRVQFPKSARQAQLQSLYTPDEITYIDWLERQVNSALHPHAHERIARGPLLYRWVPTRSSIQYDARMSGAFSGNPTNASQPSNTISSLNEYKQDPNDDARIGSSDNTYHATTAVVNPPQHGTTSVGELESNSRRSFLYAPRVMQRKADHKDPEAVQPNSLANQDLQRVASKKRSLMANDWNADRPEATNKGSEYFPGRALDFAATHDRKQQSIDRKVFNRQIPLKDIPVSSVLNNKREADNPQSWLPKSVSKDEEFTVLVPSDSDDSDENPHLPYSRGPYCHHYLSGSSRR